MYLLNSAEQDMVAAGNSALPLIRYIPEFATGLAFCVHLAVWPEKGAENMLPPALELMLGVGLMIDALMRAGDTLDAQRQAENI